VKRSAATDRRSINAQIEVLLWEALARRGIGIERAEAGADDGDSA